MLEKYLPRTEFESYEDFIKNYKVDVPDDFNFGYDIIDGWADAEPDKTALVWCDDHDEERKYTYKDLSRLSSCAAHYFQSLGIGKGDVVMCILHQRYEYWITAIALCKLGAIIIPATMQLTAKDIVYRANAAKIKAVVCYSDGAGYIPAQMEKALPDCPTIEIRILTPGKRDGWLPLCERFSDFSAEFERPSGNGRIRVNDPMLIYFTSGTTGMPKMVMHNFDHPLGHIVTAKYWQQVRENKLHQSEADSGWAKFGWGKMCGQLICGAPIFAYDAEKFIPKNLIERLEKYRVATFCAPPTIFRFMLAEGMEGYDFSAIEHCGNAGEPLSPEVFNKIKSIWGLDMH